MQDQWINGNLPELTKGCGAKNPNIEANFQFHIKEYKKADDFSENMQIQAAIPNNLFIKLNLARTHRFKVLTCPFLG